jgi:hypothetical protein
MAFIHDTVMMANKAMNRIPALARQASSYYSHPTMLRARGIASSLANGAKLAATSRSAMVGGLAGGAIGAGYNYATDRRSNWRSMASAGLKGAAFGVLAGMGNYGMKSMGGPKGVMSSARSMYGSGRSFARNQWADVTSWAEMGARDSARFGGAMR